MNHTTVNTTLQSCGFAILRLDPANISRYLHAVFIFIIAVNAFTCPVIILLNILVMVAVKTKRHLRSKSNIALACLATTDLVVGLVVQPLHATSLTLLINGEDDMFCTLTDVAQTITVKCCAASLHHLLLVTAERYIAIKHTFQYQTLITEVCIIMASGLAWAVAILVPIESSLMRGKDSIISLAVFFLPVFFFCLSMVYFNVAVYKEVRRNEEQIAANQVSPEAREKILKNKKAFYTTTIVLLVIFLCYIPVNICFAIVASSKNRIPASAGQTAIYLFASLPVLNSLLNPLIYAVRIRHFRVAFIQLLARKTAVQAQELERNIFGPKQIGVMAAAEQRQDDPDQEEYEEQGIEENTTQPQE